MAYRQYEDHCPGAGAAELEQKHWHQKGDRRGLVCLGCASNAPDDTLKKTCSRRIALSCR